MHLTSHVTLDSLIFDTMKDEIIEDYTCSQCRRVAADINKKKATRSCFISKYPKVLIIQLKRFTFKETQQSKILREEQAKLSTPGEKINAKGTASIIKTTVIYRRYMTINIGMEKVRYELIGVIAFGGNNINAGHYISYVLNSDNQWYELDDIVKHPKKVTAFEVLEQDLPYLLYYKQIDNIRQEIINNQLNDMIIDSYGIDNEKKIAVALQLHISYKTHKPIDSALNIINNYKNAPCQNLNDFKKFLKENKCRIHFYRSVNKKSIKFNKIYSSCVPNGTCGFQLHHLLRERTLYNQNTSKDRDRYINLPNSHITTPVQLKLFTDYLYSIINDNNYFRKVKRPIIDGRNKFKSYDDWIYKRALLREKGDITQELHHEEKIFYKYVKAYHWIKDNPDFANSDYPVSEFINGKEFKLWFGSECFPFIKDGHKFSIFQNIESFSNHSYPYIPNYFILSYTTSSIDPVINQNDNMYDYDLDEVTSCAKEMNDGAHDINHYYLLQTFPLENSLNDGLTDLMEIMNYILEYGEFRHPHYDHLYRWGLYNELKRSYIYSNSSKLDTPSNQPKGKLITTGNKINKGEIITIPDTPTDSLVPVIPEVEFILDPLTEKSNNTIVPACTVLTSTVDVIDSSPSNLLSVFTLEDVIDSSLPNLPASTIDGIDSSSPNLPASTVDEIDSSSPNLPASTVDGIDSSSPNLPASTVEEALEIQSKIFNMILPNIMFILKDNTYQNDIKYKTIKLMKNFMNNNSGIIRNNNILNPISNFFFLNLTLIIYTNFNECN